MRTPRVFVPLPLQAGASIEMPAQACEHLVRVLRLPEGAPVLLCNGDGMNYRAQLVDIGKRGAHARVLDAAPNPTESPLRIVLAQALARGEKMDWVIQKATELGVAAVQPIVTERTEVRLDAERADRRVAHWQGIAIAACEQSGRSVLPEIHPPLALSAWLAGVEPDAVRLWLDPEGSSPIALGERFQRDPPARIHLVVGPEGGLSTRDAAQLAAANFSGMRLGPRILRTETAGLAALAVLQSMAGDLGN